MLYSGTDKIKIAIFCLINWFLPTGVFGASHFKTDTCFHKMELGFLNDSWGGGFTPIEDDYRSFGAMLKYNYTDRITVNTSLSGLTIKSWQDTSKRGRLDEFSINGKFLFLNRPKIFSKLYAVAGVITLGKFLGNNVQNGAHQSFGVSAISLPYTGFKRVRPQIGLSYGLSEIKLFNSSGCKASIAPELEYMLAPGILWTADLRVPLIFRSHEKSVTIALGYKRNKGLSGNYVLNRVLDKESGPVIDFRADAGRFFYFFKVYPVTNFSVGGFGAKLIDVKDSDEDFKGIRFAFEAGSYTKGYGYFTKALFSPFAKQRSRLFITLTNSFGTLLKKRLAEYPFIQGHYQQAMLGSRLMLLKCKNKFQLNPFIELALGYHSINFYSGKHQITAARGVSMVNSAIAGILVSFKVPALSHKTLYGLTFNYNYSFPYAQSKEIVPGKFYTSQKAMSALSLGLIVLPGI